MKRMYSIRFLKKRNNYRNDFGKRLHLCDIWICVNRLLNQEMGDLIIYSQLYNLLKLYERNGS